MRSEIILLTLLEGRRRSIFIMGLSCLFLNKRRLIIHHLQRSFIMSPMDYANASIKFTYTKLQSISKAPYYWIKHLFTSMNVKACKKWIYEARWIRTVSTIDGVCTSRRSWLQAHHLKYLYYSDIWVFAVSCYLYK